MHTLFHKLIRSTLVLVSTLIMCTASGYASAEIIDDVRLKTDTTGDVDAFIRFTVPIQYVRHFPNQKSSYLTAYFNILDKASPDQWQNYESHRSPPSDLIVGFTITTRDLNTGPRIEVQFNRAVEFSVTSDKDGRGIVVHIKSEKPASPQTSSKDGLPLFPWIAPPTQSANILPENPSLSDVIKQADNQSSVLMTKGRDALLSGQLFVAIDAFNETLKLPPNKYSQDAQLWIGIAKERTGQSAKAKLEYESYLKLYPDGVYANWVKDRLAKLNAFQPSLQSVMPKPVPAKGQSSDFQYMEYGSLASYYYYGESHTDTIMTVGNVQTPTSLTVNDQSSLISNVNMTARAYNNEYDNRIVFQDLYSQSFLPKGQDRNRLNSAYVDFKNRIEHYSARIGRQSAFGGGVLGRFDGITAGYGLSQNWRTNIVAGQLSDVVMGSQPIFYGASLDFGVQSTAGGSLYAINQIVSDIVDRRAVGGNFRYFDQGTTAIAMVDYDIQFRELNIATVQGTINTESGTDYNFLLDRRKTPSLSISSSVYGTMASVGTLLQNGWTSDDLIALAKLRSAISNLAQFGITNHFKDNWQISTDVMVSNISAIPESGTLNPDGTTGLEGFVAASAASGDTWSITERLIGNDVISSKDISMCSVSYSKNSFIEGETLLLNSRSFFKEQWTFDKTIRLYQQTNNLGSNQLGISPVVRIGYRIKNTLTLEAEGGADWTQITTSSLASSVSSLTERKYLSFGFRWDL